MNRKHSGKKRRSPDGKEKPGKRPEQKPDASESPASFVKVYYPVFENLVLFILNRRKYWQALQTYLKKETGQRATLALYGLIFLVVGLGFLLLSTFFLAGGVFLAARNLTGSVEWAVLIMFGLCMLAAVFLLILMLKMFRKTFDFSKYEKQRELVRHED